MPKQDTSWVRTRLPAANHKLGEVAMSRTGLLLAVLLASSILPAVVVAQSPVTPPPAAPPPATAPADAPPPAAKPPTTQRPPAKGQSPAKKKPTAARAPEHYRPSRFSKRAELHYAMVWGVDSLGVKWVESGEVIRFNYRVLDADKARTLNDKKSEPSLIAPRAGVSLVVPSMEKVGQLRQSEDPEAGKSYWMAFSNKGRLVKRGDRVNVVIGQFRAEGLVVD
jgi:hypothetical protein